MQTACRVLSDTMPLFQHKLQVNFKARGVGAMYTKQVHMHMTVIQHIGQHNSFTIA